MVASNEDFGISDDEKHKAKAADRSGSSCNDDPDDYANFHEDGIETQFTWRAVIVGSLLGCVVASSNMYLGLKIGWTFSAGIFGAILGFAILKVISRLPPSLGGGPFGIKENCTVQTAATASGGLSAGFVAGVPAMFRLGLLPPLEECWSMFYLWTLAAGFYGLFFAIPLRTHFVIKQKLVFPSPTAAAHTIRSLHSDSGEDSITQTKWIIYSLAGSTLYKVFSFFVPFVVDLHPLYWLSTATGSKVLHDIDVKWGWKFQITTAFLGAGMMVGLNTALSFFGGNLFAWGILGPILMYSPGTDVLHDKPRGFSQEGVRAQVWFLWVGIVVLVCASFTELALQYESLWRAAKGGFTESYNFVAGFTGMSRIDAGNFESKDPVPQEELIPTWVWVTGLSAATVLTVVVLNVYFDMTIASGILAGLLGFIFSFIGCQSSGETDINPTGVIGKASQIVFAAIPNPDIKVLQLNNLIAGTLSASCASQGVDMVSDLKTGHLLKASPRSQFYAQMVGACFGIVVAVVLFMLFATAYPCILKMEDDDSHCEFAAPSVAAWTGVTQALTTDISKSVPPSCRIACLVFAIATIATIILKRTLLKKYADYLPNWNAVGVAFVSPEPYIPVANLIGALIAFSWARKNMKQWQLVGIALASGLIAGEGIGGVIQAIFTILGLSRTNVATGFACPDGDPESC